MAKEVFALEGLLSEGRKAATKTEEIGKISDLALRSAAVEGLVGAWLADNNLSAERDTIMTGNSALTMETAFSAIGGLEGISKLVESCGIPTHQRRAAMETVASQMDRFLSRNGTWSRQGQAGKSIKNDVVSRGLETIYAPALMSEFSSADYKAPSVAAQEAFGATIDTVIPDMKTSITVALMRFMTGIVNRALPNKGTSQPNIQLSKVTATVYDLSDSSVEKRLLDLYENPDMVNTNLRLIVPLATKAVDSNILADGILAFGKKVNILTSTIDATKYGFDKVNRTDLVADNVQLASVRVTLTPASGAAETFLVSIPTSMARLTRVANGRDAGDRAADIEYVAMITGTTTKADGTTSAIAAALTEGQGYSVTLKLMPTINIKKGIALTLGTVTVASIASAPAMSTAALYGYSLDARFSEENLRKSNLVHRTDRQPFSYDIPTGRNFLFDSAIGQEQSEDNGAMLTRSIRVGMDGRFMQTLTTTLDQVEAQVAIYQADRTIANDPGVNYVAGSLVECYVYSGTMDLSKVQHYRSADISGDVKQFAKTFLMGAISKILKYSKYQQQLADGQVTFRMITGVEVLNMVIGQAHIHDHLDKESVRGSSDGIEYRLVLDGATVIEVITTTFADYRDDIVMFPVVKGSDDSVLNWGCNWDFGTMVGHYMPSGGEAHHRLFANARELVIPTNPIGARIQVGSISSVSTAVGA